MNTEPPLPDPGPPPTPSVAARVTPTEPATPWGFWLTLAFSLCIAVAYVAIQSAVVIVAAIMEGVIHNPKAVEELAYNGLVLSIATLLSVPVGVGLSVLFAWIRPGLSVCDYLGLNRVPWKLCVAGLVAVVLMGVGHDGVSRLAGRPEVPEFMINAYLTAKFPPLLWLAVVVGAPIVEETFFRGFLFRGLAASPLGGPGTIVVTSLAWAAIHLQYDLYDMGTIFVLGLLLGVFRLKAGSLWPPLFMHALVNLLATIQVAILLR